MERRSSWAGRGATVAGRPESWDFLPARFCGRSRTDLLLVPHSEALLPLPHENVARESSAECGSKAEKEGKQSGECGFKRRKEKQRH